MTLGVLKGLNLSNFDTILSTLQGTYDKILLNEIEKWFIINIFHKLSDKRWFIHSIEKLHFPNNVQQKIYKNGLTENLSMGVIWRNFHSVVCGNYGILLPRFCCKNFVKLIILLKNFTLKCFDEKKIAWQWIHFFFHIILWCANCAKFIWNQRIKKQSAL